ncbi:lytic transglycosylase domain-containing protein [Tepidibacter aestuarii]|uniref:lytic transglycosylase domain-containing protein n=1 Tax=Tepidibacter aestuarii TaxID=2925782 RepID=UPI002DD6B882|nr:lytic transglycosylase domain-containing protein [Tepidibacter aestuarii]CAH2214296.1 soluble lytic murein transglycosylase [Tepidibacter aestuarii]
MIKKKYFIICAIILIAGLIFGVDKYLKIVYPKHYEEYVMKYSKEYDIDPYLVFSIMKAESKFFPYAESNREAKGLMQISNITQQWAQDELQMGDINIFNPETNIQMGCWYISKLFNQFDDKDLVIAAYNGGSGNVEKWLKDQRYSNNGINLQNIPFKETRDYVDKVNKYYERYKAIYEK